MKKSLKSRFFLLSVLGIFVGASFASSPAIEVATWANFCQGAISHTFDDYAMNSPPTVVLGSIVNGEGEAAFYAKGFHATIFTISSTCGADSWKALQSAFAHGHEIASHNKEHNSNDGLKASQDDIKKNVPGEMCVSLAYPNGQTISGALKYFIAARNISGATNAKTPSDFSQINTQGFGSGKGGYQNTAAALNSLADQAASGNKWATGMHHGIGSDKHDWAVTSLDAMKSHLDYLDKNRSKIWCETFGNVARYIKERDAVGKPAVKSSDDKSITVELKDNLADSIFNFPLTLRTALPSGWTTAAVKQGTKAVWDSIVTDSKDSKKYIWFKAVPDAGDIVISKDAVGTLKNPSYLGHSTVSSIKRQHSTLVIDQRQFNGSKLSVTIFDLKGKTLAHYSICASESSVVLPMDKIGKSAFVVKIIGGNKSYSGMILPQI